ncbi:N-acetylneuraminate lyase [Takifugu flavidus]|uniref:N-acetylneuraminate lyase n=1 Tax=Takifugu flavidus TaxID=433684 RepID=A0A5C6MTZ6_9TELE|nr:N-acetylneuraminate lyase [Takifugu flavidus]
MDQVIVHVGCMSLKDSQELARHAAHIGASGIAVIAPSFFKPSTAEVLQTFLQEIAAVAPTLPFYYYHLPAVTGVKVPAREVLQNIEKLIPSFSGVKFSGSDLLDFGQCVSCSPPHWSLLYGVDEFQLQELLSYAIKLGFDLGVNKQLMIEVSGLSLGPPRLPVRPCPHPHAKEIAHKYQTIFL